MLSVDTTAESIFVCTCRETMNYGTVSLENKMWGKMGYALLSVDTTAELCLCAGTSTNKLVNCDRSAYDEKGNENERMSEEKPTAQVCAP